MTRSIDFASLYRSHLEQLDAWLADALSIAAEGGVAADGVVFHSGRLRYYHRDDRDIVFRPHAHFRRWVPPLEGPDHLVLARPGRTPKVVRMQPTDFWFETEPPASSHWEGHVDLTAVSTFDDAVRALGDIGQAVFVGDEPAAAEALGLDASRIEPAALMAPLDWHRAVKTEYEIALTRIACEKAAAGHLRARELFLGGASEREIHWQFLRSTGHLEAELPYSTIVALDHKSATLHYENKRGDGEAEGKVLLLDAGAAHHGYAADLTRTWVRDDVHPVFAELVREVDAFERHLVGMSKPGLPYTEFHLEAHRKVAEALHRLGIVTCSPDEAIDTRLTRAFFPHGIGHLIGLQVHDVAGHQATPAGGDAPPPDDHVLRNTRTCEPGHLFTIEPGIYFIPVLLEPWRQGDRAGLVDWDLVDALTPHGGVRIEDNVVITDDGYEDLSRDLIEGRLG